MRISHREKLRDVRAIVLRRNPLYFNDLMLVGEPISEISQEIERTTSIDWALSIIASVEHLRLVRSSAVSALRGVIASTTPTSDEKALGISVAVIIML